MFVEEKLVAWCEKAYGALAEGREANIRQLGACSMEGKPRVAPQGCEDGRGV